MPRSSSTNASRTPRTSTGCSAATTTRPRPTIRRPGTTSRRIRRRTARAPRSGPRRISTDRVARRSRAAPVTSRPTRHCSTHDACTRSSSGITPATRLRWWSGSAACPRSSSSTSPRHGRRTPAANAPRRWCTAWAGRSTRWARSTSAPGRSSSCCWATSAGPAAGSSRCAGTPASRDRPTCRRCSTCYPATSRCRRQVTPRCRTISIASSSLNQKGFWHNADTYMVSLLKEYWGENATAENDYCFDYLPRINGDHGTYRTVMDMVDGKVFGYFLLGQNPAVGSAHGRLQRLGMANLDWLVVRDLVEIESATFWKDGPEVETGEITTEELPHGGVPVPRRVSCGEGGHVHADRTDVAVAGESRRTAGRRPLGAVVLLPPGPDPAREAGRLDRRARPAAAGPDVGRLRDGGRRAVG